MNNANQKQYHEIKRLIIPLLNMQDLKCNAESYCIKWFKVHSIINERNHKYRNK
jgi:hypothetical protein